MIKKCKYCGKRIEVNNEVDEIFCSVQCLEDEHKLKRLK